MSRKPAKPAKTTKAKPRVAGNTAAKFDEEMIVDQTRPLTAAEQARWERARRKAGRPQVGQGVKVICVSVERGLLTRADRLAKKLQLPRTQLIALGLEALLEHPPAPASQ